MNFLRKIQQLPEKQRTIIFWSVLVVVSVALIFFWAKTAEKRMGGLEGKSLFDGLDMPEWEMPDVNVPEINEENLNKLKQIIEEAENAQEEAGATTE
jgi:hypothetical protein